MTATSTQPIIDVHCHCTLQRFQRAVLDEGTDWHGMTSADGELGNIKNRWKIAEAARDDGRAADRRPARLADRRVLPIPPSSRGHGADLPGSERGDRGHGPRAPRPFHGPGDAPDAGSSACRRRDDARHEGARPHGIHDRRSRERAHVRPRSVRADLGGGARPRCLLADPPVPAHDGHVSHAEVLPAELDREPRRPHDHLRGLHLRRRARSVPGPHDLSVSRGRLCALCPGPAGQRVGGLGR